MFAIDIDGVIANSLEPVLLHVCRTLGVPIEQLAPLTTWDVAACFPEERRPEAEKLIRRAYAHNEGQIYTLARPIPGALDAALWLHQRQLLKAYITSRPDTLKAVTSDWLEREGFPQAPVYHTTNKAGAMAEARALVMVEDSPEEIKALREAAASIIIFDAPYNRDLPGVRISDWSSFMWLLAALPLDYRHRAKRGF
ncbi:MAG TPA: hypothetical protein VLH56_01315 [Dissulfurispiraceae bacterium]|nr:hypothetical protein [Dissulfurispiraceae bacterium]